MLGPERLKVLTYLPFPASYASLNNPPKSLFPKTFTVKPCGCTSLAGNLFILMKRRNLQGGGGLPRDGFSPK